MSISSQAVVAEVLSSFWCSVKCFSVLAVLQWCALVVGVSLLVVKQLLL